MRQMVGLGVVLLVGGLGGLFTFAAIAIRRDVETRFRRIAQQLERDALAIISRPTLDPQSSTLDPRPSDLGIERALEVRCTP